MTAKHDPEEYARELLSHLKLDRAENVEDLAKRIGLDVREVDSKNFEGALIRAPTRPGGIVAVRRSIRELGRRNFTIAHEVGHFVLPGHGLGECYCKSADIESWRKNVIRAQELDANEFASEILLPSRVVYPVLEKKQLTLATVKGLCVEFDTSLTATLVKCVKITEEVCAMVCSVDGAIKWSCKSENFHHFVPNAKLTKDTLAGRLFEDGSERELSGQGFASSWIEDDDLARDATLWEESILLPHYNTVLTILTI